MRFKWLLTTTRRVVVLLVPSLLLLLYLLISDRNASQTINQLPQSTWFHSFRLTPTVYNFTVDDLDKRISFSPGKGPDVMVFLHMQKTGGTFFGKNLVKNVKLDVPCKCWKGDGMLKCPCMDEEQKRYWMFSRYSTGWKCGLHADYTELSQCLKDGRLDELEKLHRYRKYHYVSVLRDPSKRYVSEWQHVSRGASWFSSTLRCNGRSPTVEAFPHCFTGDSWLNVSIDEFLKCPHNLARNRQTRMLANLSEIGCYSSDMMDNPVKRYQLLESAKHTLRSMPYFCIMSYVNESQYLFERTFNLKFIKPFYMQKNRHNFFSGEVLNSLPSSTRRQILEVNDLDVQLYEYAKQLFLQRYRYAVKRDAEKGYS